MNNKWTILLVIVFVIFISKIFLINKKEVGIKNITEQTNMKIESDIILNNGKIPVEYTCNGKGTQLPLKISNVSTLAKSLALIVDDPDAPSGDFVHWVVWNINPTTSAITDGVVPLGSTEGHTSLNKPGYVAPCPPSGVHHYNFKLYALDTILSIPSSSNKTELIKAMNEHLIDSVTFIGLYGKNF